MMYNILASLVLLIKLGKSVSDSDLQELGANHYFEAAQGVYGTRGGVCGIYNNKVYLLGGILNSVGAVNAYEATLTYSTSVLEAETNYSQITTPWNGILLSNAINTLSNFPGYQQLSSKYYCFQSQCSYQLNSDPYIYIVGATTYDGDGQRATPSMVIYDMANSDYIQTDRFTYTIPGGSKQDACVTGNGTNLFIIGGKLGAGEIYSYRLPSEDHFVSTTPDDEWTLLGYMRFVLWSRGCTTDKATRSRYLYMFGGRGNDDRADGWSDAEYLDLNTLDTLGFNASYFDMGPIIDLTFRLDAKAWIAPHAFASQYAQDIIYLAGNIFKPQNIDSDPYTSQVMVFERVYAPESYPSVETTFNFNRALYGCRQYPNNGGDPEYSYFPKCAGALGHGILSVTSGDGGYPTSSVTAEAPRPFAGGCITNWMSGVNSGFRLIAGGFQALDTNALKPIIFREEFDAVFTTTTPTKTPTDVPTSLPTLSPSISPSVLTAAPQIGGTGNPTKLPTLPGQTNAPSLPPTPAPPTVAQAKTGLSQPVIIGIAAGAGVVVVILIVTIGLICYCNKNKSRASFDGGNTEMY